MASQPLTGINQRPLVFAQIRQGSSSPEVIKARIVTSSRVVDIKSNMFLHLFYNKPYQRDQGYNHAVDQAYGFQVKSAPADSVYRKGDILAAGPTDVGDMKTEEIAEREMLTLSEDKTWNFKPSVRVADFFANSLGVPIDCWTPCSRIAISRELEAADLIKYELQCGDGDRNACAMEAGELARALHDGDQMSFEKDGCVEDLMGNVELSILFVNANPDIQSLDFRLRMRIRPCRCPPVVVKVGDDYYRAKLTATPGKSSSGYSYVLDDEITEEEAKCLGYDTEATQTEKHTDEDGNEESHTHNHWDYPTGIQEVGASTKTDTESGENLLNMDKSEILQGAVKELVALNKQLNHVKDTDNDGIIDSVDLDDDNDGFRDENDAFPQDSTQQTDHNGNKTGDIEEALADADKAANKHQRKLTLSGNKIQGTNAGDLPDAVNSQMVFTQVACGETYNAESGEWTPKTCDKPLGMLKGITGYAADEPEVTEQMGQWTYEFITAADFTGSLPVDTAIFNEAGVEVGKLVAEVAAAQVDESRTGVILFEGAASTPPNGALYRQSPGPTGELVLVIISNALAEGAREETERRPYRAPKAAVPEQMASFTVEAQDIDQLKRLEAFQASGAAPKHVHIANDETEFEVISSAIPQ